MKDLHFKKALLTLSILFAWPGACSGIKNLLRVY